MLWSERRLLREWSSVTRRLLFVGDSESQIVPAFKMARRFAARNWTIVGNIVPGKSHPTRRQLAANGIDCPLSTLTVHQLFEREVVWGFDAIVVMLPGSATLNFRTRMESELLMRSMHSRPIIITGYNGVVYERHLEGLLWRVGYDYITVNSRRDLRLFSEQLERLGASAESLISTGIVHAQASGGLDMDALASSAPGNILFAAQAVVPNAHAERAYLLEKLRAFALGHPERTVFVKSRAMPDERTFHKEKHHYEQLHKELYGASCPANLVFGCGSLLQYLPKISLLVSVSSTAVLEGIAHGVPGAILSDVGLKESLGNHFFIDSGLITTMDALIANQWPRPNREWLEDNGFHPEDDLDALLQPVCARLSKDGVGIADLSLPPTYYDQHTAPYIFETRLPFKAKLRAPKPEKGMAGRAFRKTRKLVTNPSDFVRDSALVKHMRNRKSEL